MRSWRSCTRPRPACAQSRERAEPEVENGLGLQLAELEPFDEACTSLVGVVGSADESDYLVEVVQRDEVALEHVRSCERLAQLVLRTAGDDLLLEVEVVRDELEERERPGHTVDERHVEAKRRLERGVLEKLVERDLWDASRLSSIWMRMPVLSE